RNQQSRATDCKWRVNGNLPKNAILITFTIVVDKHNHPMVPLPATNIARYCKLGEDMVEFIEFCVHYGVTSAQSIGRLLKGKFLERKIYQKGLYDSIQIAKKKTVTQVEFDTSDLIRHLYSRQTEDSYWFVEAKFVKDEHRLCGLVWLLPEQQNLWTCYHDVLFFDTTSSLKMIKKCMNNLTPKVVFMDSDPTMINAISLEFPDSIHCLYIFHIDLNLKKNLRNKLGSAEFKEFREAVFKCRNTLVPSNFENQWESLKAKYTSISTGANSTQQVESLNCKIHDRVRSRSSFLNMTKKIQELLDKESEFAKIKEYKEQISTIGLPTITKTYFNSLEKIVSQFLLLVMVFTICKQMQKCFCYDSFQMDKTVIDFMTQEHINNDNIEGAQEDNYKIAKIYFADIIIKNNYVILLADGSYQCTCNMIITHGYPCRHFYKVLCCSTQAKWHIGLIASCWYKDSCFDGSDIWQQSPITICINSNQNQSPNVNNKRQIYGRAQGIIRKALDIAIATSSYNELMGICHRFILDKQESQEESDTTTDDDDIEYDIKNSVISK
ncbi:11539_t:CDS:2, partial [Gigaspora margarita]